MRKKQGFTLIELLAVIVILAVIALIATPIVIGIIEDSKVKANENSAYGIIDSAKYYYAQGLLKPENKIEYNKDILDNLTYNGEHPKTGSSVFINQNGEVAVALLYGNKCYVKEYNEAKVKEGNTKDCKITIPTRDSSLKGVITNGIVVTTGSGLYKMNDSEYRYRGGCTLQGSPGSYTCANTDPINNYVSINGQKYRIISVDNQGVKVISQGQLNNGQIYDKGNVAIKACTDSTCPRNNANNTFCKYSVISESYWGCGVYAAVSGEFTSGGKKGTVTKNSTLYDYLNIVGTDEEIVNLQNKALTATWNIGAVEEISNADLLRIEAQERANSSVFKVGLINSSDYIISSIDENCQADPLSRSTNSQACKNSNWLFENGKYLFTMNPYANYSNNVWVVDTNKGYLSSGSVISSFGVRPVAYLSSNELVKSGDGTSANPWIIE